MVPRLRKPAFAGQRQPASVSLKVPTQTQAPALPVSRQGGCLERLGMPRVTINSWCSGTGA